MPLLSLDRVRNGLEPSPSRPSAPKANSADEPAVLTVQTGGAIRIVLASPRAREMGVCPGMTLGEAQAVAPGLRAHPHCPVEDQAVLQRLARWALRYSPVVQPWNCDSLLLDITGCERLFRGEIHLARSALGGLLRRGIQARAAIADSPGAAYALASSLADGPFEHGDRHAYVIVPPGHTTAYLTPLPPAALRIDAELADRLWSVGIRSIGDLLMIPRSALSSRFPAELLRRLQQALGEIFEPLTPCRDESRPLESIAFDEPVRDAAVLKAVTGHLFSRLTDALNKNSLSLRRLTCIVYLDRGRRDRPQSARMLALTVRLSRASRAWSHVARLLDHRLESVDPTVGVYGLRLIADQTEIWKPPQTRLFPEGADGDAGADGAQELEDEASLGRLVDLLADQLGYAAILRPHIVPDHQPEMAYRLACVADAGLIAESRARRPDAPRDPHPNLRPLQLFRRPERVRAIAMYPDGPPTWLFWGGAEHTVDWAWGPERIETAWWRGPDVRRDYFQVALQNGVQLWVFHHLLNSEWFVHGVFV